MPRTAKEIADMLDRLQATYAAVLMALVFKFKSFEISPGLHGQPVLFEFISTGDLFDLFDHVKAHLRSLP